MIFGNWFWPALRGLSIVTAVGAFSKDRMIPSAGRDEKIQARRRLQRQVYAYFHLLLDWCPVDQVRQGITSKYQSFDHAPLSPGLVQSSFMILILCILCFLLYPSMKL
jgi:hypothetical protein